MHESRNTNQPRHCGNVAVEYHYRYRIPGTQSFLDRYVSEICYFTPLLWQSIITTGTTLTAIFSFYN
jgi:hypothetical protein